MAFVTAVNRNGTKQLIPEHWLDHPVLGRDFRRPRSRRLPEPTPAPEPEPEQPAKD